MIFVWGIWKCKNPFSVSLYKIRGGGWVGVGVGFVSLGGLGLVSKNYFWGELKKYI